MLIDLHTHTHPGSWDSFLHPDELVERSKQAGLDALVLSEHDWAWEPEAVRALARRHDFPVIAGMEINTEDGHILVYGMHRYVFGMHRSHELAGHVAESNGVMVAAHPYRRQVPWNWDRPQEYVDALARAERNPAYRFVAALETVNGRGTLNENRFAEDLANNMGMPSTGGTDSHQRSDIGKCATYFEREIRNEEELIEELRAGRCWAVDLTSGALATSPLRLAVPDDLHGRWRELGERRAARAAAEPHVHLPGR